MQNYYKINCFGFESFQLIQVSDLKSKTDTTQNFCSCKSLQKPNKNTFF